MQEESDTRTLVFEGIIMAIGYKKAVESEVLQVAIKKRFPDLEMDAIRKYQEQLHLAGFIDYVNITDGKVGSRAELTAWMLTGKGVDLLDLLVVKNPQL